jgi:hypothetical protein
MDTEYRLSSKKVERNVLRVELPEDELWQNDRYQRLEQQIQELKKQVEDDFGFAEAES